MENIMMDTAISQGIWAVIAVFLLVYIVKSNEKRDKQQEAHEENYQKILLEFTEKFSLLNSLHDDLKDIKEFVRKST